MPRRALPKTSVRRAHQIQGRPAADRLRPLSGEAHGRRAVDVRRHLRRRPRHARRDPPAPAGPARALARGAARGRSATTAGRARSRRRARAVAVHGRRLGRRLASSQHELRRKVEAGQTDLASELAEGSAPRGPGAPRRGGFAVAAERPIGQGELGDARAVVEPVRARSAPGTSSSPSSGSFRRRARSLPRLADLGFDVVYLPPIHPIGAHPPQGPKQRAGGDPRDPGSPWAIGAPTADTRRCIPISGLSTISTAWSSTPPGLGLEIALDFAVQCSPDHPWLPNTLTGSTAVPTER